jgi:hypothetical protein
MEINMRPEEILFMTGCSIGDVTFTLDPKLCGEIVCWNVTRAWNDARDGRFGPPIKRAFATWPEMTKGERDNIDWKKVAAIAQKSDVMAIPALAMDLNAGVETHRHIIDGNHRVCAREQRGLPFFEVFVVPQHLEPLYRVTCRDGNGKPIAIPY